MLSQRPLLPIRRLLTVDSHGSIRLTASKKSNMNFLCIIVLYLESFFLLLPVNAFNYVKEKNNK